MKHPEYTVLLERPYWLVDTNHDCCTVEFRYVRLTPSAHNPPHGYRYHESHWNIVRGWKGKPPARLEPILAMLRLAAITAPEPPWYISNKTITGIGEYSGGAVYYLHPSVMPDGVLRRNRESKRRRNRREKQRRQAKHY